jgi:hypothetical protein
MWYNTIDNDADVKVFEVLSLYIATK